MTSVVPTSSPPRSSAGAFLFRLAPGVLAALAVVACGQDRGGPGVGEENPSFSVVDSAGVQVAWNAQPSPDEAVVQRVAPVPQLRLGGVEDEALPLWRFGDAILLEEGRVMIAHAGGQEILVVDDAGQVLHRLDATGGGPGEFTSIRSLSLLPGGDVAALDPRLGKLLRLSADAQVLEERLIRPQPGEAGPNANQVVGMPEWGVLVQGIPSAERDGRRVARHVQYRLTEVDADGEVGARHENLGGGPFPDGDRYRLSANGSEALPIPGTPSASIYISPGSTLLTSGEAHAFQVLNSDGSLRMVVRTDHAPASLTPDYRAAMSEFLAGPQLPPEMRAAYASALDTMPWPETLPAIVGLLGTSDNARAWVQEPAPDHAGERPGQTRWAIYELAGEQPGRRRGWVHGVPENATVLDIQSDRVLLLQFPELGVPVLAVHALEGLLQ